MEVVSSRVKTRMLMSMLLAGIALADFSAAPAPREVSYGGKKTGKCAKKCSVSCLPRVIIGGPIAYATCFGLCLVMCEVSPQSPAYECTRSCAQTISSKPIPTYGNQDVEDFAERFVDSCYKNCTAPSITTRF